MKIEISLMLCFSLMHISVFGMQKIAKPSVARVTSLAMVRHCASKNNSEKENAFKDVQEALGIKDSHYLYAALFLFGYMCVRLNQPKFTYRYPRSYDK